ncbi:MAG: ABC transporter ATP-binding protein [Betaproteobacteria bacterium]|nr:ABC transporter ATP-binding protein [Betaproteobacteria bacterium]
MDPLVRVEGLRITARKPTGEAAVLVDDVGFEIPKGEVLALIGESGSGKTTVALSLLGYARPGCRIESGRIVVDGIDVLSLDDEGRYGLRGRKVAYIAQSAAAAFNPMKPLMDQVIEAALIHGTATRAAAEAKAVALFADLALPDPGGIGRRYPHQVSGGQLQRLMAAMALITDPGLVVLDEPTTALDVTTQIEVLRAFRAVVRDRGATAVYVSHDLAVVAQMADRIVVLNGGRARESGTVDQVINHPRDEYTRRLVAAAAPQPRGEPRGAVETPLLEVRALVAGYGRLDRDGLPAARVLEDIDLTIARGAAVGVIGESGCGKTTLARVIAGLVPAARGDVRFDGQPLPTDLRHRSREQFRRIQIVFQNADTVLNPAHSIERILARPLAFYRGLRGEAARARIAQLLDLVKLPASVASRRPSELSGGQKQRVNLARALAADPDLILCDEVTSALDTVVGAAILDLLADLRRELGVSYLFISHDISTVRAVCDEVVVLYAGRKVDAGDRAAMGHPPFHPYADLLIASVPALRIGWLDALPRRLAASLPPVGEALDEGLCPFLPRCAVRRAGRCDTTPAPKQVLPGGREILCHVSLDELARIQSGGAA